MPDGAIQVELGEGLREGEEATQKEERRYLSVG